MDRLRIPASALIAVAAWASAIALLLDRFLTRQPDVALGTGGAALAIGIVLGAVSLRPARSRLLPLGGILLGLVLLLYASWLLDPTPTAVPERTDLIFGLGITAGWFGPMAVRIVPARRLGLAGAGLLLAAFIAMIAAGEDGSTEPQATLAVIVLAVGLGLVGGWALRVATHWNRDGLEQWEDPERQAEPPSAAWKWARPLPAGISALAALAGAGGMAGGLLLILSGPAASATSPGNEIAELVFGLAYVTLIVRLMWSAPKVGAVTSPVLSVVDLAFPLGLLLPAVIGGIAVASVAPSSGAWGPIEVTNAGLGVIGISIARLGWIVRSGSRWVGVLAGLLLFAGGLTVVGTRSPDADPGIAATGELVVRCGWLLSGIWLAWMAARLQGAIPIETFRLPHGLQGVAPAPPPKMPRSRPAHAPAIRAASHRTPRPSGRTLRHPGWTLRPTREAFRREPTTQPRYGLDELARRLGVTVDELRSHDPSYRTFRIPKRSGGSRTITAPDTSTKALQRRILHRLIAGLPAHDAAHGFELGRSIVTNADRHAGPAVLVKLDLEEFFRQTRTVRVRRYWRVIGWDREAARVLTRLTTHAGGLPQGAPTSPRLANLVNVRLDARLAGLARVHGAVYTRYADDLTFSFRDDDGAAVRQLIHAVRRICWSDGRYRVHLNRKVEIRRRHERQEVTGLVVNDGPPRLSRDRRRWLRAVEYRRYSAGAPTIDDAALRGWQALEAMIDKQAGTTSASPGADIE